MTEQERLARALSLAISQETVAGGDGAPFRRLHAVLRELYPRLFTHGSCQIVAENALLVHIPGERVSRPLLFLSHMDVVPAQDASQWRYPPFSGKIADGFVWGRGACDMKGHMTALLFACEELLASGWTPKGDLYIALSCDEELRGGSMRAICGILAAQGVRPAFVLDEGSFVTTDAGLIDQPVAYVGVQEKGRIAFSLSCEGDRAMECLTSAAVRIARVRGKKRVCPAVSGTLLSLADALPPLYRHCALRPALGSRLLLSRLQKTPYGRAVTRTRHALCALRGDLLRGERPRMDYAASVLPGDSAEELLARIRRAIGDERIHMEVTCLDEPSARSPAEGAAWDALTTAIMVHFPHTRIAPCLLAAGTDARRHEPICRNIYRFSPFILPPDEQKRIHGRDERISLENLSRAVNFFRQMLQA